jgi:hypothetical protein
MNRRHFIALTAAAPLAAAEPRRKAPFRVIYSNDLTNITSCASPFHAAREPFRPKMLDATVDEVTSLVDAHFFAAWSWCGTDVAKQWDRSEGALRVDQAALRAEAGFV